MTTAPPLPTVLTLPSSGPVFYLFVPGSPDPAGSPKPVFLGGDRSRLAIRWQKGHTWTAAIRRALMEVIPEEKRPLYRGPVLGYLHFVMPKPLKPKFKVPATPPDVDKLERAILDGFVWRGKDQKARPILVEDDARFIGVGTYESFASDSEPTGVRIWVWAAP